MYSITIIFSYNFKIVNNKEKPSTMKTKPMVETKTAQYVHDIELLFTEKKNGHKQEIKKISNEIKRI